MNHNKFENILSASKLSKDDQDWLRCVYAKAQAQSEPAPAPATPFALTEAQYMLLREQWAISLAGASGAAAPYSREAAGKVVDSILDRLLPMMHQYGLGLTSLADLASTSSLNMACLDKLASLPAWCLDTLGTANNLLLAAKDMPEDHLVGVVLGSLNGGLTFNLAAIDPAVPAGTKLYALAGAKGLAH